MKRYRTIVGTEMPPQAPILNACSLAGGYILEGPGAFWRWGLADGPLEASLECLYLPQVPASVSAVHSRSPAFLAICFSLNLLLC